MTDRTSKTVTAEHEQALKWARQQNFTSVSARYAKLCAEAYDIARSAVETFGERRLMATRGLLDRAIQVMTEFHAEFEPDDSPELRPTTSVHAFKDFVDRHARLMYERAQLDKGLPEEPTPELYTQEALDAAHQRTRERLATLKVDTDLSEKATAPAWDCACNELDCPYCANRNALNG